MEARVASGNALMLNAIRGMGFDLEFTRHANTILEVDFQDAAVELDVVISSIRIPISEMISGGGGEAKVTQRLRNELRERGWAKKVFTIKKQVNGYASQSSSHEVDHVKEFERGILALEIEWNNKDPFFDRDLENFQRLHQNSAISMGIIITRGASFQGGIEGKILEYAQSKGINSESDLQKLNLTRTPRQKKETERAISNSGSFSEAWAKTFASDKFGSSTTHWSKLKDRLDRGVGNPCPLVAIGIPLACVDDQSSQ